VEVESAPDCPYGYYDAASLYCAPYGLLWPGMVYRGVFIGTGPWFHGPENFRGHVNNVFIPNTAIPAQSRNAVRNPNLQSLSIKSPTSKGMKCAMGMAR